jgi:hypothetical protein
MGPLSLLLLALSSIVLSAPWIGEQKTVDGVKYQCKCYSDNACFPSPLDWAALNKTVGGALKRALPPGAPCFRSVGNVSTTYDAAACADVQKNWANEQYLYVVFPGQEWVSK